MTQQGQAFATPTGKAVCNVAVCNVYSTRPATIAWLPSAFVLVSLPISIFSYFTASVVLCIGNKFFCTTGDEDEDLSSIGLLLSEDKSFLEDANFGGLSSSGEELNSYNGKLARVS